MPFIFQELHLHVICMADINIYLIYKLFLNSRKSLNVNVITGYLH